MGGKSDKPDTLNAQDMMGLAREESSLNEALLRKQTMSNRPEQITPYGKTVWEDLGGDQWRQTTSVTPEQQRAIDAQSGVKAGRSELAESILGRASEDLGNPVSWESMEANEVGTGDEARQRAEDAIYGRATSRLDPMFGQKRSRMDTQLRNQGLKPGDEAYDTAMGNLGRQETDAYSAASQEAIARGGAEATRTFGLDMQRRQQALAEELKRRGVTINEINALNAGQQVSTPDFASFAQQGRPSSVNLTGAAQTGTGNEWDRYNANEAEGQSAMSGIMSTAATLAPLMMMSDRRLKSDIILAGHTQGGQRVYEYTIFGARQIGVMADESPPEAVHRHPSGYLMVDYSRIK